MKKCAPIRVRKRKMPIRSAKDKAGREFATGDEPVLPTVFWPETAARAAVGVTVPE